MRFCVAKRITISAIAYFSDRPQISFADIDRSNISPHPSSLPIFSAR
jgi:hypothetical protein